MFIFIMASSVGDIEPFVFHMVDEAVFFVDAAAVFTLHVAREGVGFTIPFMPPFRPKFRMSWLIRFSVFLFCACR